MLKESSYVKFKKGIGRKYTDAVKADGKTYLESSFRWRTILHNMQ